MKLFYSITPYHMTNLGQIKELPLEIKDKIFSHYREKLMQ